MEIEIDRSYEATITALTKFGAFAKLPNGQKGLIHISEISEKYVKSVHKYLTVGDVVLVKVLNMTESGKIALSIKAASKESEEKKTDEPEKNERFISSSGELLSHEAFIRELEKIIDESEERLQQLDARMHERDHKTHT